METAATALEGLSLAWGLSLSILKAMLLVAGTPHSEALQPLQLAGGIVECVTGFQYLGSMSQGRCREDFCERIAKASHAFGMLKELRDRDLSITTKRLVYNSQSVVLGVLLYGSEPGLPHAI